MLLFQNVQAVLEDRVIDNAQVVVDGDRIVDVGSAGEVDAPADAAEVDGCGGYLAPGFVDLHVHGGDGADFMDGTPDAVRTAAGCHTRHGTTTIFPTTTTGSPEQITAMLTAAREVHDAWQPEQGGRIGGVHFYGPYFAPDKAGCHSEAGCRAPDPDEYNAAFDLGIVKIATCAAELPGAEAFYAECARRGYFITCGHSNSDWAEMARGYAAGMRHVDHFWCVMSSVASLRDRFGTPMRAGMEQFVLAHEEMSTEVIADGCHLSAELLDFAYRMKGVRRLCLVTDASRAVDMPPGRYRFGPQTDGEWFESDGQVGFDPEQGPQKLASSAAGMDRMVRTMAASTSAPLHDVIRMASLTPAERVGISDEVGSLAVGKRADLVLLSPELHAQRVFVAGVEFGAR